MKEIVDSYSNWLSKVGIILVILSSFFLFTNLTTEFYDTAKFLALLTVSGILLVFLAVRFTVDNKVAIVRTPMDIPLLLLLVVAIVSTFASPSPYISLLGNQLRVHGSMVSWIVYIIFFFVLVNSLKSAKEIRWMLFIATLAGAVLSSVTLLSYAGIKILPPPWVHGINFTPTGSSFSTTAVLALLVPFVTMPILSGSLTKKILNSAILTLFGTTIALTGTLATQLAALLGLGLTIFLSDLRNLTHLSNLKPTVLISLAVPVAAVILVSVLSFIPPIGGAQNPLYASAQTFPRQLQLDFISSWKISVSTFRDSPFWGSGPSTYLFDFTSYKPIELNSSPVWNLRFDNAFNEYLQVLAELGIVGLVALLSLTALFISAAYRAYKSPAALPLVVSGLLFFVILALHSSTLVLWVFGLFILASFFIINLESGHTSKSWAIGQNIQHTLLKIAGNITSSDSSEETIKVDALPSILVTVSLGLTIFTFYMGGKFAVADYHHRIALNAVSANQGIVAYNELVLAENLNPYSDLYRTDLAQTNFALANAIASAKGPTEASPSGSLTAEDQQNIQVLLQQSINEGRNAVALNPRSALNWEILALLYRQIAGVAQDALVFSLDAYGRAIFQDPLNPNLRLNVGGIYYAIQNYDMAIRFFTDAINLKGDFANGYYNLSVAMRDKGDLTGAQAAAERILTLVDSESADYKLANDYLTDLKNRIASGSAQQSSIQAPAAQTTGALQEEKLPKVVDVGEPPEEIATPEEVKKPDSTPEPTPTPNP